MQRYSYTWIISRWYSITKTFHIIFVMLWFICIYSHFSTSLQTFQTVIDPVHFRFHFQSVPAPGLLRWRVASRPPSCCPACPSSSLRSRGPPHTHTHTHTYTYRLSSPPRRENGGQKICFSALLLPLSLTLLGFSSPSMFVQADVIGYLNGHPIGQSVWLDANWLASC